MSCVCYAFVQVCLFVPCGHLLGKGWPLGSSLWCLILSLSLSHWYPGSGVVLDCIDSKSLHSYLLLLNNNVDSHKMLGLIFQFSPKVKKGIYILDWRFNPLHVRYFFYFCCHLLTFFKTKLFQKFFQEPYQSVSWFGSISGPKFCRS